MFVEERRCQLDDFLQATIACGLGATPELGQFVRPDSSLFPPPAHRSLAAVTSFARTVGSIALWPFLARPPEAAFCNFLFANSHVLVPPTVELVLRVAHSGLVCEPFREYLAVMPCRLC